MDRKSKVIELKMSELQCEVTRFTNNQFKDLAEAIGGSISTETWNSTKTVSDVVSLLAGDIAPIVLQHITNLNDEQIDELYPAEALLIVKEFCEINRIMEQIEIVRGDIYPFFRKVLLTAGINRAHEQRKKDFKKDIEIAAQKTKDIISKITVGGETSS